VLSVTPGTFESGRPESNGPLRAGDPALCRLSYVRAIRPAGFEPASSALARRRSGPLSYERMRASGRIRTRTPAVQRACAAVDTTEAKVEMAGVEPAPPRCKRDALPPELHPQSADGWSRTTKAGGTRVTAWGAHQVLSVRVEGWLTGFEPTLRGSRPRVLPLHHSHHVIRERPDSNRHPFA
jgi:hypothetical protein